MQLEEWINKVYLNKNTIKNLKYKFLNNKPYPNLELNNFLKKEKAKKILLALANERFYEKESDLFSFHQTNDISSIKNKTLQEFRNLLYSKSFLQLMKLLTGLNFKIKIDLAGSLYRNTNYLLCHDDLLEGRNIAFLLYLSTLSKTDGGSLNLMDKDLNIEKKLIPIFNTFTFFKVSKISYHEVGEVIGDKQRIALGGWFHDK